MTSFGCNSAYSERDELRNYITLDLLWLELTTLENASKTTSEQINNEINALDTRIKKIKRQVGLPTTDDDLKAAESEVAILQRGMKEVDSVRTKLAEFFCEDPGSFKLEECFKIFQNFAEKFKQAVKENERRQQQEEQATLRRKQREEQLARRARQLSQCGTPVSDTENPLLLDPSFDPRASPALSRRRMGSFNTGGECNFLREDGTSTTPNGSLRRRRSRVLAEEDDLMEFLRSSGHDNGNRERKSSSYGSLGKKHSPAAGVLNSFKSYGLPFLDL